MPAAWRTGNFVYLATAVTGCEVSTLPIHPTHQMPQYNNGRVANRRRANLAMSPISTTAAMACAVSTRQSNEPRSIRRRHVFLQRRLRQRVAVSGHYEDLANGNTVVRIYDGAQSGQSRSSATPITAVTEVAAGPRDIRGLTLYWPTPWPFARL